MHISFVFLHVDHVFDGAVCNRAVFESIARPIVYAVMEGFNGKIISKRIAP